MDNNQQRTIVRKKDRALLAAIGVFAVAMAMIAILGLVLVQPPKDTTQGQADCDHVRVSGKLPGRVERIFVTEGQMVHRGDTIAKVYSSTADAKLYQAQQMAIAAASQTQKVDAGTRSEIKNSAYNVWQQAIAAETIAQKTYQRMQSLYEQGVITEQKRDEAKAAADAASAQVKAAKSQYDMAVNGAQSQDKVASRSMANAARGTVMEVQSLLEDQYLLAPCDGEVAQIYPQEGELVAMGAPVVSLAKMDDMWVSFSVREELLRDLPMGKVINTDIPALGLKDVKMRIYYVHDMGTYAVWQATKAYGQYDSKTFEVKARPETRIENFRPGMSVILK
jgi:HlyD family secretion protein